MTRRNTTDPLVRAFLDTYKLNLLSIPRSGSDVGDLYVETPKGILPPSKLTSLLTPNFIMPAIHRGERMVAIQGKQTRALELNIGIRLLQGFLSAIGASSAVERIKASYEQNKARFVRFAFDNATRDSVDVLALGNTLVNYQLRQSHMFNNSSNRYYAVTGVVRTPSISIVAEDDASQRVDVGIEALQTIELQNNLVISRSATGGLTYAGQEPLAIGVELVELSYNNFKDQIVMTALQRPVEIRADEDIPRCFIGDQKSGDIFLTFTD